MKNKIPHIQVDAFPIVDSHFSGVGHYTLGIVRGFDELAQEGKITYSLVVPRKWGDRINKHNLMYYKKIIKNPIPNRVVRGLIKYNLRFPINLLLGKGYYWFPSFTAWPVWFTKFSTVIHDVAFLAVPKCVEIENRRYLEKIVPISLKNSQNIITVSEFSKSEIVKYYNYPADQVHVAPPSIDRRHFYKRSAEEVRKVRLKYDIFDENYILSVGNIEPRKNYERLIDAYVQLPRKITAKYPLVLIGAGGWMNDKIKEKIQKAKEDGLKIINPKQFVLDEDMPALFTGAQFFIFPSIYEGFGMPVLEAMACGTPTLASKVASMPEAGGKAAIYVDPFDVEDIKNKMLTMIKETEEDRSKWDDDMRDHLRSLSWRKSAEITASALTGYAVDYFKQGE